MRLHKLSVTAFGPFAGQEQVDFDALASGGLFLLSGPTGAGKTSVLDAVCFALYGSVPGSRSRARSLRSDHAEPQLLTEVELELTLGGRRLLIRRRPEQRRPKLRGEGFTLERAQTLLSEWSPEQGEWRARSGSHQEIGAELHELIGMSREQFTQVVLLPQGEFARFLQAGAQERRELLGRLFDTRRFGEVEGWLTEHRQRCEKEAQAVQADIGDRLSRLQEAAGPGSPAPEATGGDGLAALAWAATLRERAALRREIAASHDALAEQRRAAAAGRARAAGELFEQQQRHRRAAHALAELTDQQPAQDTRLARLRRAEQAAALAPVLRRFAEARATASRAAAAREAALEPVRRHLAAQAAQDEHATATVGEQRAAVEDAYARSGTEGPAARGLDAGGTRPNGVAGAAGNGAASDAFGAGTCHENRDSFGLQGAEREADGLPAQRAPRAQEGGSAEDALSPDALRAAEREAREQLGELRGLVEAERRFADVVRDQAQQERRRAAAEDEREEAAGWLAGEWPGLHAAAQAQAEGAQHAAARREALDGQLESARQRLTAAQRRDGLERTLAEARETGLTLRERAAGAQQAWLELKQRRLDGMAAELATRLAPGAPCAVCGATEHPRPAKAAPDQVTPEAEQAAEAAFRAAERRAAAAAEELGPLATQFAAAEALAGSRASAELREEAEALRARHAEAEHAEAQALAAVRRVELLERERQRRAETEAEARSRVGACEEALLRLAAERESLDARLAEARAGAASVAERSAGLARQAEALGRALEAVQSAESAWAAARQAHATAEEECARAGFGGGLDEAAAAALGPADLAALRATAERFAEQLARARAEAESPELRAAAALPSVDPASAQAAARAAQQADAQRLAAHAALAEADRRIAALAALSEHLADDVRRLGPFAERLATATELAQLVAGTSRSNELRMSLENYVLAARLEQVAASAGARLSAMSHGRYSLEHTDARAKGGARSGLGLQVLDAWTGQYRDTATLSGGESFFASLALALGLADVVTDEAGGMPLDTLFVDEGFGTLDADTLEEVMSVLDSLRERDRAVGIVSHVAELRDRIPHQLQVRKSREGSTLRQAVGASMGASVGG